MLSSLLIVTTDFDHPLVARVHYLVQFLLKKGIDVHVINIPFDANKEGLLSYIKSLLTFPKSATEYAGMVFQLPKMPLKSSGNFASIANFFQLTIALALSRLTFKTSQYDVVVATGPLAGFVANFVAARDTYLVYEDTDLWASLSKGTIQSIFVNFLENRCLRKAELVVSNSKLLATRARSLNSNSVVISNGVDLSFYSKPRVMTADPRLTYIGSIVDWSGLDLVFKALPLLVKRIPRISFRISGDGPKRQALEKLVSAEGMQNYVFFLGKLPYSELPNLLLSSHLGIAMFKPDKFAKFASPLKLFEYMAAGLPIVATDVGETRRIISESGAGICVGWDINEFVDAVEKLLIDRELWLKCHKNGLSYVKRYDWNALFDRWLEEVKTHIIDVQGNSL